jgi:hypothetical protein
MRWRRRIERWHASIAGSPRDPHGPKRCASNLVKRNPMRRLQFSVKSLLLAVLVLSVLLSASKSLYEWWVTIPKVPLAQVVAAFNERRLEDPVGKLEPPITEAEVVSSINAQLATLNRSLQVQQIYADIAKNRLIDVNARLYGMSGFDGAFGHRTVWWINLDIVTGKNSGYGLRIRENNDPQAKPADEPSFRGISEKGELR